MPKKPVWYRNLPAIIEELRQHPHPYIDRSTLETVLGVGRRRAQQILAPLADRVGTASVADREAVIRRLEQIAASEEGFYEIERRRKVAGLVEALRRDRLERPQLVVEARTAVVNQEFDNLPPGVRLEAGRITVEFQKPHQALEKLLALAMAISNDFDRFERAVAS